MSRPNLNLSQLTVTAPLVTILLFFLKNFYVKMSWPEAFIIIRGRIVENEYASSGDFAQKVEVARVASGEAVRKYSRMLTRDEGREASLEVLPKLLGSS